MNSWKAHQCQHQMSYKETLFPWTGSFEQSPSILEACSETTSGNLSSWPEGYPPGQSIRHTDPIVEHRLQENLAEAMIDFPNKDMGHTGSAGISSSSSICRGSSGGKLNYYGFHQVEVCYGHGVRSWCTLMYLLGRLQNCKPAATTWARPVHIPARWVNLSMPIHRHKLWSTYSYFRRVVQNLYHESRPPCYFVQSYL